MAHVYTMLYTMELEVHNLLKVNTWYTAYMQVYTTGSLKQDM
jgi:hypothetical protein